MSSFNDILASLGGDKSSTLPAKPIKPNSSLSVERHSQPSSALGINGIKRKAEEEVRKAEVKASKPSPTRGPTGSIKNTHTQSQSNNPKNGTTTNTISSAATAPGLKAPAKGSFADILARAKAAQEHRGQNQIGMIKHQAGVKERPSKMMERRNREEEMKDKTNKAKLGSRSKPGHRGEDRGRRARRSASPAKLPDRAKLGQTGVSSVPKKPVSSYKGTMGLSRKGQQDASKPKPPSKPQSHRDNRPSRLDEYLATDEEDNSDLIDDGEADEDDFESEGSSDMEAGAFDVAEEEERALKAAKVDDARELEEERRLKREKEERKKKLMAMVKKRK